jgi:tagatose kinase
MVHATVSAAWLGFIDGGIGTYLSVLLARLGATPGMMSLLSAGPQPVNMISLLPAGAFVERQSDLFGGAGQSHRHCRHAFFVRPERRQPTLVAAANLLSSAENFAGPLIGTALAHVIDLRGGPSMPDVVSIGNMLVEIMRLNLDEPLDRPGAFVGPFPSGDTPIYIDAVARLGYRAGFIGVVGDDGFGRLLCGRLAADGVDCSCVRVQRDNTTGAAFVAYFSDGHRDFIFHWRHAAAGMLSPADVPPAYLQTVRWLHITGCNLAASDSARQACYKAIDLAPPGAKVSFDPNIRPGALSISEIRDLCRPAIERADVILPSLSEAAMLTDQAGDEVGCRLWAGQGKTVVLKMGARGCRIFSGSHDVTVPAFQVEEVDPTGAGDSFCAGFTVATLDGMNLAAAGRFANAVGALAVTKKGPMEGAPRRAEVERLLTNSEGGD